MPAERNLKTLVKLLLDADYAVYLLILVFGLAYALVSLAEYYSFIFVYDWDLAAYNQTYWTALNYGSVKGVFFWNTLNFGHFHIHFEPIMFLILPLYALSQRPETLLLFGSFFLRLGALPLYWLARDELNSKRLGFLFALIYLTYAPLLGISWFFFPVTLAIPFLLFSFYFFKKKKWVSFWTFTILALMTKETIAIVIFFMGVYFLWENKSIVKNSMTQLTRLLEDKGTLFALLLMSLSLVWFVVASRVMAFFTSLSPWSGLTDNVNLVWWSDFGTDSTGVLSGIISDPSKTIGVLASHLLSDSVYGPSGFSNLLSLVMLFVPLLFIPFLGIESLLIPLPYVALYLLSNNPFFWTPRGHHAAPLMPFIFIACVYGVKRLRRIGGWFNSLRQKGVFEPKRVFFNKNLLKIVLAIVLCVNVSATMFYFPQEFFWGTKFPLKIPSWSPATLHDEALREVIALIPPNASVLTHTSLLPYLSNRLNLYPGWRAGVQFDYILADTTDATYAFPPGKYWQFETLAEKVDDLWNSGDYGVVTAVDGIWLLKRGLNRQLDLESLVSPDGHGLRTTFIKNNITAFSSVFLEVGPRFGRWGTAWEILFDRPQISSLGAASTFVTIHPFLSVSPPFSAVLNGYLYIPQLGEYGFASKSDGSVKLVVDSAVVIDDEKRLDNVNSTKVIFDEEGASFWTLRNIDSGGYALSVADEHSTVAEGNKSLRYSIVNGSNKFVGAYHHYDLVQDWSDMDYLRLYWYGTSSGNRFRLVVGTVTDNFDNSFVYTFGDFWTGWRQVILPLDKFTLSFGSPTWSKVTNFLMESAPEARRVDTSYVDRIELIQAKSPSDADGTIQLERGWHSIQILYIADEGHANIHIQWLTPWEDSWQVLPGENLYLNPKLQEL